MEKVQNNKNKITPQLNEAINYSEDLLSDFIKLFETTSDFSFIYSVAEKEFKFVSKKAIEFAGYTRSDFYNDHDLVDNVFHLEGENEKLISCINFINGENILEKECSIITKSSEIKKAICKIVVLDTQKNSSQLIACLFNLKKSEPIFLLNNYKLFFDESHDAIFILNKDNIILANKKATELFGFEKQENLCGLHPYDLSPEKQPDGNLSKEKALKLINAAYEKSIKNFTWEHIGKFEMIVNTEISLSLLNDGSKKYLKAIIKDCTKEVKLFQKLNSRNSYIKTVLKSLPIAIYVVNTKDIYKTEWVSDRIAEITGFKKEQFSNSELWFSRINIEHQKNIIQAFELLNTLTNITTEYQFKLADGTFKWFKDSLISKRNKNGELIEIIGIVRDITERKQLEEEYQKNQTFLKAIIDNIPAGAYLKDAVDFKYISLNKTGQEMMGLSFNKIQGKTDYDIFSKKQADQFRKTDLVAAEKKEMVEIPIEYVTSHNSTQRIVHTRKVPLLDRKGNPEFILGLNLDITDSYNSQKELFKAQELYKEFFDYLPLGVLISTPEGGIININKSACRISGYTIEEILLLNLKQIYEDPNDRMKMLELVKKNGAADRFETKIRQKNGNSLDVNLTVKTYKINEQEALLSVIEDISEIKEKEKQLFEKNEEFYSLNEELSESVEQLHELNNKLQVSKEKAVLADKLKSSFLANISHEVRTPVNGIMGFLSLLGSNNLTDEKRFVYTEFVNESCTRLIRIIDDIMEISKIESGNVNIVKEQVNLTKLLNSLFLQYNQEKKDSNIKFTFDNKNQNAIIFTDKIRIFQILSNLIDNAFKFTEEGSVSFGYTMKNNNVEFYVRDTGIGISSNLHKKIFERFRQAEIELSRQYEGNGLGLSIAESLVKLLGGKIWLESELEKGTTFYFTIPIDKSSN